MPARFVRPQIVGDIRFFRSTSDATVQAAHVLAGPADYVGG